MTFPIVSLSDWKSSDAFSKGLGIATISRSSNSSEADNGPCLVIALRRCKTFESLAFGSSTKRRKPTSKCKLLFQRVALDRIVIAFIFPSRAIRLFSVLISPLCAPILSVLAQPLLCTAVSGSCSPYLFSVFKYGWSCQATIAAVSQLELLIKYILCAKVNQLFYKCNSYIHSVYWCIDRETEAGVKL